MRTLVLLRHAKSSWDTPVESDFARPLAPRGERYAPRMGKVIKASGLSIDRFVSSTAKRARQTAELASQAAKFGKRVEFDDAVYEATVSELFGVLRRLNDEDLTVVLVGHNPGFEDLLGTLCSSPGSPAHIRVPTAALACIELDIPSWQSIGPGTGTLLWMTVPKMLA